MWEEPPVNKIGRAATFWTNVYAELHANPNRWAHLPTPDGGYSRSTGETIRRGAHKDARPKAQGNYEVRTKGLPGTNGKRVEMWVRWVPKDPTA